MKAKNNIPFIASKDIIIGNPNALVKLMAFIDYESEKCAQANEVLRKLLAIYGEKINLNFRHFPLMRVHQKALKAAEAAISAAQEEKFLAMHEILFKNRKRLGTISLSSYAKEIGMANKSFLSEIIAGRYGLMVHDDLEYGVSLGVKAPPAIFINNKRWEENITEQALSAAIDKLLNA